MEDLGRAHALIEQLLALVRKHGFAVNPSKCTMMVKLEGTQAQTRPASVYLYLAHRARRTASEDVATGAGEVPRGLS